MLVTDDSRQRVVDALQTLLDTSGNYRILILPVDAALPRPQAEQDEENGKQRAVAATREELYGEIEKGARLDGTFRPWRPPLGWRRTTSPWWSGPW